MAVALGPLVQGKFIIYKGLNPGDTVVVEGFQKIRPGAAVQPIPWKDGGGQPGTQNAAAPAPGNSTAGSPAGPEAPATEPKTPAPKSAAEG
jgi:membrane fusion protein (multidrug efflux system)